MPKPEQTVLSASVCMHWAVLIGLAETDCSPDFEFTNTF